MIVLLSETSASGFHHINTIFFISSHAVIDDAIGVDFGEVAIDIGEGFVDAGNFIIDEIYSK